MSVTVAGELVEQAQAAVVTTAGLEPDRERAQSSDVALRIPERTTSRPAARAAMEQLLAARAAETVNQLPNPLEQLPPGLAGRLTPADVDKLSRFLAAFVSSGDDVDRPKPISDAHPGPRTVALSAAGLLRGDILGGQDGGVFVPQNQRDREFRTALYARVLDAGFVLHLGARQRAAGPVLDVALTWGPHHWPVAIGADGKVGWRELLDNDTLRLAYAQVNLREQVSGIEAIEELREAARGPLPVQGRKLGEIVRRGVPWEPDVRLGAELGADTGGLGFRDQVTAMMHMYGSSSGRALLKTPLGYFHVFELTHALDVLTDFGRPDDGIARISSAEGELGVLADAVLIVGRGGVEFRPSTGGWTAPIPKDAVTLGDSLLYGAILGDFWDDPDAEAVVAQIVVGLIPGIGQAADVRDIAAGIDKLWATSGKDGKVQTLLAVIGLVPGVGDAIKSVYKGGKRAIIAAIKEATPMARRSLAALIRQSPNAVRTRFGLERAAATAAAGELEGLVAAALRPGVATGSTEVRAAVAAIERTLDAASGNAGAVVLTAARSRSWRELARVVVKGGPDAEALALRLNGWRAGEVETLQRALPDLHAQAAKDAGRTVTPPRFEQSPAVAAIAEPVRIASLGPDGGAYVHLAKGLLERRYGMAYEEVGALLDLELRTDAARTLIDAAAHAPLGRKTADRAGASIDEATLGRYRAAGAHALAAAGPQERALFTGELARTQRELELDALHRAYVAAPTESVRIAAARELAALQGKLDMVGKQADALAPPAGQPLAKAPPTGATTPPTVAPVEAAVDPAAEAAAKAKPGPKVKAPKPPSPEQQQALNAVALQRDRLTGLLEEKQRLLVERDELLKQQRNPATRSEATREALAEVNESLGALDPSFRQATRKVPVTVVGENGELVQRLVDEPIKHPPGEIAKAEEELLRREDLLRRVEITLYDRVRAAVPAPAAALSKRRGVTVDQVGGLKTPPTALQVDHIVPVREIVDMPGFEKLSWADQKAVVDLQDNLIVMDGSANGARGDWPWSEWRRAGVFYDDAAIKRMVEREREARRLIRDDIARRLKAAGKGP